MQTQNQCLTIDKICVPQIKIGKQQIFNTNTQHSLFPIYYQIKHNLIIKTARLFIPKKLNPILPHLVITVILFWKLYLLINNKMNKYLY